MSEAGTTDYTPQTMSLSATESPETSRASTRASTPAEIFESDPVALPMTPRAGDRTAASDDVPMMDISPGKEEHAFSLERPSLLEKGSPPPLEGPKLLAHGDVAENDLPTE